MPRPGPRRPLFAARVDADDVRWVEERADREGIAHADFARRMVSYARLNMPMGWQKPEEDKADNHSRDSS